MAERGSLSARPADLHRTRDASIGDESLMADLQGKFLEMLRNPPACGERLGLEVWRLFSNHPWYLGRVRASADVLVRMSVRRRQWVDDIVQDSIVLLAGTLRLHPDLSMDLHQIPVDFSRWMHVIVHHHCCQSLRVMLRAERRFAEPIDEVRPELGLSDESQADLMLDILELEQPYRSVLMRRVLNYTPGEISKATGLHIRKVYRILETGRDFLRCHLS